MHKLKNLEMRKCLLCHRRECDGSEYKGCSSHDPQMEMRYEIVSLFYCDLCGQVIEYNEEARETECGFLFYTIESISLNKENHAQPKSGWGKDLHFHKRCFKNCIKPLFLQRLTDQFGYQEFSLPNSEENIIERLSVERETLRNSE